MKRALTGFALLLCFAIAALVRGGDKHPESFIVFATNTPAARFENCIPSPTPFPVPRAANVPYWYNFCSCNLKPDQLSVEEDFKAVTKLKIDFYSDFELSIQDLSIFPNLRHLEISNAKLSDMESLANFSRLKWLELKYCDLRKLDGITELENLRTLILSRNMLSELEGIERLTKLECLDVSYNGIETLKGVESLTSLNYLDISDNSIESLESLCELPVRRLHVQNNPITTLNEIADIKTLEVLNISDCTIDTLEPLTRLQGLRHLDMWMSDDYREEHDPIITLEPLTHIKTLESITINPQRIHLLRDIQRKSDLKIYLSSDHLFSVGQGIDEILTQASCS